MDRIKLQKEFRQMVKDFDGEKAHNNVAGSVCEHYAIEFAIQQVKNCSIPLVMPSLEDARVAKESYMEKKKVNGFNTYITGVGNHFQDGVNWALNKIKKLN